MRQKRSPAPQLDPAWARAQFTALAQQVSGRPAVFFDGPGGTQVPDRVIDAMSDYLRRSNANVHGAYATSRRTDEVIDDARRSTADLLGCDADEIVFGPNMTTLAFSVSRAIGLDLQPGDEIVVTKLDHDANVAPWRALEERGIVVVCCDIREADCTLDMEDLDRRITARTRLVAITHASNAVGTIPDVTEIVRRAHAMGALAFVDAVHYTPHGPLDVRALDCDFLACSPYKFFGPHLGILYGKRAHLQRLRATKVRPAPDTSPERWETGTQSHEGLAGLVATIDYLQELGERASPDATDRRVRLQAAMKAIRLYERGLAERLIPGLLAVPGLTLYGIPEPTRFDARTPTAAVRIAGQSPRSLASRLGEQGIFTWNGNYYAVELTERLGVESSGGMLRIGLVHYNTAEEIDRLLAALHEIAAGPRSE